MAKQNPKGMGKETMIKDYKKHQLEENWNQYNFKYPGSEMTFADYICTEADNDPGFFRWLFDDETLADFECKERNEWETWVVSEIDIEEDLTDDIEVARYNVPYSIAKDSVDYSLRYYNFHGICVFMSTQNDEIYLGNVDEIGNFEHEYHEFVSDDEDGDGGWWNINEARLAKLKKEIKNP